MPTEDDIQDDDLPEIHYHSIHDGDVGVEVVHNEETGQNYCANMVTPSGGEYHLANVTPESVEAALDWLFGKK